MQQGFLASYEKSVDTFLSEIRKVGNKTDAPYFASIVLTLKHHTLEAYQDLTAFKKKASITLLDHYMEQLLPWGDRFQQIYKELHGTLEQNIKPLIRKHPELFHFTRREVCLRTTSFLENPEKVDPLDMGAMNICMVMLMNKRFRNLLHGCICEQQKRTDGDSIRIFRERWEEYKKTDGEAQINYLKQSCNRLSKNGKLTQTQYDQLSENILNEIDDPALRRIIKVNWEKPISLIKALRAKGYGEEVMEEVFCACTKLEELKNIYEQTGVPEPQNYNEKLTDFTTACVQDIQATTYSKDKERLIRNSNDWFFVHRIFLEMGVEGLTQRKQFVQMLKSLPIKVDELPMHPCNLNRIAQEFRDRNYPNWEPLGGRFAAKHERYLELGAAALKAYENHKDKLR